MTKPIPNELLTLVRTAPERLPTRCRSPVKFTPIVMGEPDQKLAFMVIQNIMDTTPDFYIPFIPWLKKKLIR